MQLKRHVLISGSICIVVLLSLIIIFYQNKEEPLYDLQNNVKMSSKVNDTHFSVYLEGKWEDLVVKGVNMGIAKPGYWPGETAITYEEYKRWFNAIGGMGANVIRIYTIHPPGFYQALYEYNEAHPKNPLYLLQGVWINEARLADTLDASLDENTLPFEREMNSTVDVVHGSTTIIEEAGHAHGHYTYDLSAYVLGYVLGIEWYPKMVEHMINTYPDKADYEGIYFKTINANPFEIWLAERMDAMSTYEEEMYQWNRPISFTNWPTTDPLEHPQEPSIEEDLVSIDPNTIIQTAKQQTGYFATYHIYPYYPEFLNYEEPYINYIDHRGEKNSYAGYLADLKAHHTMPILVGEFGVPSSRGKTHNNRYGFNQGGLSEREQGEINVHLFEDIVEEGYLGGAVFSWQDEWFKRTWNTMELDNPDRRPFWSNQQTNEQHFGLLGYDPFKMPLDGKKEKWHDVTPLYESNDENSWLSALYMESDETYLYIRLEQGARTFDMVTVLLDTIDDQGNSTLPHQIPYTNTVGFDFSIDIAPDERDSRIRVDRYYDPFYYQYCHQLNFCPRSDHASVKDSSVYHPINYALNSSFTIPITEESIPFTYYETGKLMEGNGNPNHVAYNSLSDYIVLSDGTIELRIPWLLLNVKDPSTKEIMGDIWQGGLHASKTIESIGVSVIASSGNSEFDSFPNSDGGILNNDEVQRFSWEPWHNHPDAKERLKDSYYIIRETYKKY